MEELRIVQDPYYLSHTLFGIPATGLEIIGDNNMRVVEGLLDLLGWYATPKTTGVK
jgi:hypothetical protein